MLPPPEPMVNTSILGKPMGYPYSIYQSFVTRNSPSYINEISALVPPMSNPIALLNPQSSAIYLLAISPAAIPQLATREATFGTVFPVITPTPESTTTLSSLYPNDSTLLSRCVISSPTIGPSTALITVVLVLSCSKISGNISLDVLI